MFKKLFCSSLLAISVFSLIIFGQAGSGNASIEGVIKDSNGAVIQGAIVVVKNLETGLERTVSTNSNGSFTVSVLPVGLYNVTAKQTGFGELSTKITLTVGETTPVEITLTPKNKDEIIDVIADGEIIDTEAASTGTICYAALTPAQVSRWSEFAASVKRGATAGRLAAVVLDRAERQRQGAGHHVFLHRFLHVAALRGLFFRKLSCRRRKPFARRRIDQRRQFASHPRVIIVEPGRFLARQQFRRDQRAIDRRQRQRVEAEHVAITARDLARRDDDEIFNADAIGPGFVIAGLVRQDHAGLERNMPKL